MSMEPRDLSWLREEVAYQVNFNQDDPNEDFGGVTGDVWKRIDLGINRAYRREWRKAVNECGPNRFLEVETVSWPASQRELTLPEWLNDSAIYSIDDETTTTPGYTIYVHPRYGNSRPEVSWRKRDTLQWGTTGPSETKSLAFTYTAEAGRLKSPTDKPHLIPYAHRDVIVQSASVHLKFLNEEKSPDEWRSELRDLRIDFWAHISKMRPRNPVGNLIRGAQRGAS